MSGRTFAIGDIHGELEHLFKLLSTFPMLEPEDTIVFLGDYLDRGPKSAELVEYIRNTLPKQTKARVIALRGNHEDAWLKVLDQGWPGFVLPPGNGCFQTYRSFVGKPQPAADEAPEPAEMQEMLKGQFFPPDVIAWMRQLPFFYEDDHAIYVHAGLTKAADGAGFEHPSTLEDKTPILWLRTEEFFLKYRGKTVIFGHTVTEFLPQEFSSYTPDDPSDLWAGENVIGIDTGCGNGGFLTSVEMPSGNVYESRGH